MLHMLQLSCFSCKYKPDDNYNSVSHIWEKEKIGFVSLILFPLDRYLCRRTVHAWDYYNHLSGPVECTYMSIRVLFYQNELLWNYEYHFSFVYSFTSFFRDLLYFWSCFLTFFSICVLAYEFSNMMTPLIIFKKKT